MGSDTSLYMTHKLIKEVNDRLTSPHLYPLVGNVRKLMGY